MVAATWTDEEVAKVIQGIEDNLSASEIGRQMGKTKGQVSGIISRRGLCGRSKRKPRPSRRKMSVVEPREHRPSDGIMRHGQCQYPIGDPKSPDYHSCGAKIPRDGRPYCDRHHALCTQPGKPR